MLAAKAPLELAAIEDERKERTDGGGIVACGLCVLCCCDEDLLPL